MATRLRSPGTRNTRADDTAGADSIASTLVRPPVSYARIDEDHIAFAVVGRGPTDLVLMPEWATHVEAAFDYPISKAFVNRLSAFSRVVLFDKRGVGPSALSKTGATVGSCRW
jgi:hypothetical protein